MKFSILIFTILLSFSSFSKGFWEKDKIQNLKIQDPTFIISCSLGLIEGCSTIRKFGINPNLTANIARDIWDWGAADAGNVDYTYPTDGTAPIDTISSSSALDLQDVSITGLDINGNEVTQIATLNGQNKVTLVTHLWRVYRASNLQISATATKGLGFNGNFYVYEDTAIVTGIPTDASKVRAYIFDGNNQTQMTQYTVPKGYTALIVGWTAQMARKQATAIVYKAWGRPYGSVFKLVDNNALSSTGTAGFSTESFTPIIFPEMSDINVSAESDASVVGIALAYNMILLKNSTFGL